jgi:hypothetical protein
VPATFDRLAREPVEIALPDGTTAVITQQDAVAITYLNLSSPVAWPRGLLAALAAPVPSPAPGGRDDRGIPDAAGRPAARRRLSSIGGQWASLWADTAPSRRIREYPALIDAADSQAPYFGRFRG